MLDATDRAALGLARLELERLRAETQLADSVFLLLANKQDAEGAMEGREIISRMQLAELMTNTWSIHAVSVLKGTGIDPAFDWLVDSLKVKR